MLVFPDRFRVSECAFTPSNQSVSGGPATSGFQQVVASPRGRWSAKLTLQIVGEEEILAYEAFIAALQGSGNLVAVGPRDGVRPRDASGRPISWRRRALWAAGVSWFSGATWAPAPRRDAVVLGGTVSQGSTTMSIAPLTGPGLRPGHYFGVSGFLYRVTVAVPSAAYPGGQDVTFWPRLRAAVTGNPTVNLASPTCPMRLKSDDSGALSLRWREQATPTLEFVESFPVPTP